MIETEIIKKKYFKFFANIKLHNPTQALEYHEYINNKGKPFNFITKIFAKNVYVYLLSKNFFLLNIVKFNTSKKIYFFFKKKKFHIQHFYHIILLVFKEVEQEA